MKKEKDRLSIITLAVAKSYTNKAISALSEVVRYIGVTTTEISDGSTTNPITIDGSSVMAVSGDTVFYEGSAYTFDGTKWQETISFAEVITEIETITGEIGDLTALTTLVKSSIVAAINELNEKKANLSVVAALFDASVSYAVGDYCVKDGLFYKCTTAHTGAWDANDFQAVTVGNEIDANATDINGIKNGSTINNFAGVETALSGKVDKVDGKVLSTNDYDDTEKQKNANNATAITGIKNGTTINDFAGVETALDGVATALATKQNATDNSLDTDAKTIVGAINEHEGDIGSLKSGLTNYEATTNAALAMPENTGKNVLPYPFSDTTKTVNGVTFTDNGDGTISASGQATKRTIFQIKNADANLHIPAGTYTVSKSYQNTYTVLNVDGYNGNTWVKTLAKSSSTDDVTITVDYDGYDRIIIYLEIQTNIITDNIIFKPMIRPATITDPTFAPYIPSVESRIEAVESGLTDITDVTATVNSELIDNPSLATIYAKKQGKLLFVSAYINPRTSGGVDVASNTTIFTLSGVTLLMEVFCSSNSSYGNPTRLKLCTNGVIKNESPMKNAEWYSMSFVGLIN